jgi:hypothetical protein
VKHAFGALILVALLLVICAFSLDSVHQSRCEEKGGTWGSLHDGSGGIGCNMP